MMNGLPYLTAGTGSPLVVLLFTPQAANPTGLARWSTMRMLRPFTEHFTVYVVNRPPGLPPTTTMADLAAVYAAAIKTTFEGPVNVLAISTGGSIALQLAADHPDLVGRLVLGGTACALGPVGKRAQRAYIERARQGRRPSPALADVVTESAIGRRLLRGLLWLSDGGHEDHTDAVTVLHAEDGFDLRGRLHDIKAPTLLIQGDNDLVYPVELARQTVEGIPDARLVVYPGRSHSGTFNDKRFAVDALGFLK
ncbi:pimeloyl-ACP methyl ester carboxylesterase [Promicromonospora sp. AC04]|uniref:alpha/beta fold hydrolase n=1 Tax=Promicromonospora sp. AC04 TaxID=2135723 RepID=UPI000D421FAE|nr:alpha/beta hydrolase [Promicromonospora sp. AC04]PUB25507.1 pimeloyl-ACP methyl ester carboxylesterase [Promicromonospora sp. AC04]